jgi:hypothetical protein
VGSKSTNLPAIATKVPNVARNQGTKPASRVKRFERWLRNKNVESETFFLINWAMHGMVDIRLDLIILGKVSFITMCLALATGEPNPLPGFSLETY